MIQRASYVRRNVRPEKAIVTAPHAVGIDPASSPSARWGCAAATIWRQPPRKRAQSWLPAVADGALQEPMQPEWSYCRFGEFSLRMLKFLNLKIPVLKELEVDSAQLIQALASLLWPLMALLVLFLFKPAVAAIIESAKSRKFTLKIGGQELTREEANQVQQTLIADLQKKVSEIEQRLAGAATGIEPRATASFVEPTSSASRILWVDDHPKGNSYFVEQLSDAGFKVVLARSTAEGARKFDSQTFSTIISDMGRREGLVYHPTAGLDLLRLVRQKDPKIPFVIYCSWKASVRYKEQALGLGATAITSSPTELYGILNLGVGHPNLEETMTTS